MSAEFDRTLPHNLEAERAVLGAILLHPDAMNDAGEILREGHFFRDAHRRIYKHLCALSLQSADMDLVTLKDALTRAGELEEVGGPTYIAALLDGVPHSTNIGSYAAIVKEKADLRDLIAAGQRMVARAYEAEDDARAVIEDAERAIFDIAEGHTRAGFASVGSLLPGVMDKIEAIHQSRSSVTGIPTGFVDLDDMTRGFQPGNLILLAARPSQGKSALAINIAQHVGGRVGKHVGVFSLEMSQEELMLRMLASSARVDGHRMQSGWLGERDFGRLAHAMQEIADAKIHLDESANLNVFEMRARARRLKAEHGLDLLIVDYLQLAAGQQDRKAENRTLELGAMSRALKILARELKIPVLVLSQLSRAPELRSDHRPILSDLRESGALEQDADVVLFLYRDEYYHPNRDDNAGLAELIIGKQRNGPIGTVKLTFLREFTRFENIAPAGAVDDRQLPYGDRA